MKIITLISLLLFTTASLSQDLKKSADNQFANKQWVEAAKSYRKYLKKYENDSSAWYNLGFSEMKSANYHSAIKSLEKAEKLNFPINFTQYGIAKVRALDGQKEKMYMGLEKAAENGFSVYKRLTTDEEFKAFQNEERFLKILDKIKVNAYPCLSTKNYRHFDFWLGEWDVYARGGKVGVNKITMAEGGCTIHENYTTAGNYSGQSMNYYDPIDKKWHQHWVGSRGDVYNYLEIDRGYGMLQFESKFMNAQGQISLSRLTFTLNSDGTVRQLFENSTDKGTTWITGFDGLYKRRE